MKQMWFPEGGALRKGKWTCIPFYFARRNWQAFWWNLESWYLYSQWTDMTYLIKSVKHRTIPGTVWLVDAMAGGSVNKLAPKSNHFFIVYIQKSISVRVLWNWRYRRNLQCICNFSENCCDTLWEFFRHFFKEIETYFVNFSIMSLKYVRQFR